MINCAAGGLRGHDDDDDGATGDCNILAFVQQEKRKIYAHFGFICMRSVDIDPYKYTYSGCGVFVSLAQCE